MSDQTTTIEQLKAQVRTFIDERDWLQFHTPKDLSMAISVEASELLEKFLWVDKKQSFEEVDKNRQEVEDELADILITALCFARVANIDISQAVAKKFKLNAQKYPVNKAKGRYTKYNKL